MSVREYVGARYVPIVVGEWDNTRTYEPLMVVSHQGNSYTSRQYVPTGIDITNESYWVLSANYNAQVEAYRKEVKQFDNRITANGTVIAAEITRAKAAEKSNADAITAILPMDTVPTEKSTKGITSGSVYNALTMLPITRFITSDNDFDKAFSLATAACIASNKQLFIPDGEYMHSSYLDVPENLTIIGESWNAKLIGTTTNAAAVRIASNAKIINISLSMSTEASRSSADLACGIVIYQANNVIVSNCQIDSFAGAGVMIRNSNNVQIEKCLVQNTLADGIHTTGSSYNVNVINNTVLNAGDDFISFVGYQSDSGDIQNVKACENYCKNSKARGIVMLGVTNGVIANNIVLDATVSCIYFSLEATSYKLRPSHNIVICNNVYMSSVANCFAFEFGDSSAENNIQINNCYIYASRVAVYGTSSSNSNDETETEIPVSISNCKIIITGIWNCLGSIELKNCTVEAGGYIFFGKAQNTQSNKVSLTNNTFISNNVFASNRAVDIENVRNSTIVGNTFIATSSDATVVLFYNLASSFINGNVFIDSSNTRKYIKVTSSQVGTYDNVTNEIVINSTGSIIDNSVPFAVNTLFFNLQDHKFYLKTANPNTVIEIGN